MRLRSPRAAKAAPPNGRRWVRGAIGLLVASWAFIQWRFQAPPSVGGGEPMSRAARAEMQRVYASIAPEDEAGWVRLDFARPGSWLATFAEPVQSPEIYRSQNPIRPDAVRRVLVLQPLGALNAEQQKLLPSLREYAAAFFQLPARIAPTLPLPVSSVRGTGPNRQVRAGDLIGFLAKRRPADAAVYFGITGSDLYADNMNFVFGQASLEVRAGVYSLARYAPEFWKRKLREGDDRKLLRRACQVLVHEIGHAFGLSHCVFYECAMNGSNSLAEADATPIEFCPVCRRKLLWNIGADKSKRHADLERFLRRHGLKETAI